MREDIYGDRSSGTDGQLPIQETAQDMTMKSMCGRLTSADEQHPPAKVEPFCQEKPVSDESKKKNGTATKPSDLPQFMFVGVPAPATSWKEVTAGEGVLLETACNSPNQLDDPLDISEEYNKQIKEKPTEYSETGVHNVDKNVSSEGVHPEYLHLHNLRLIAEEASKTKHESGKHKVTSGNKSRATKESQKKRSSCEVVSTSDLQPVGHPSQSGYEAPRSVYELKLSSTGSHRNTSNGAMLYTCVICSKTFTQHQNLKKHLVSYSHKNKFSCHLCDKLFCTGTDLASHLESHTEKLHYSCPICNKTFAEYSSRQQHFTIHVQQKTFKCSVCNKGFYRKQNLLAHHRIHSSVGTLLMPDVEEDLSPQDQPPMCNS